MDCSIRSLWRAVQLVLDQVLSRTTLKDLLGNEQEMSDWVGNLVEVSGVMNYPRLPFVSGKRV